MHRREERRVDKLTSEFHSEKKSETFFSILLCSSHLFKRFRLNASLYYWMFRRTKNKWIWKLLAPLENKWSNELSLEVNESVRLFIFCCCCGRNIGTAVRLFGWQPPSSMTNPFFACIPEMKLKWSPKDCPERIEYLAVKRSTSDDICSFSVLNYNQFLRFFRTEVDSDCCDIRGWYRCGIWKLHNHVNRRRQRHRTIRYLLNSIEKMMWTRSVRSRSEILERTHDAITQSTSLLPISLSHDDAKLKLR